MSFLSRNRWLVVTIAHYLVLLIFTQVNYYLSPYGISIMVTGMLLAFSSLALNHTQGSLSLIPVAFFLDTKTPFPFGSSLVMLIGLHYATVLFRHQLRQESEGTRLVFSLSANLAIHLVYSLFTAIYLGTAGLNAFQIAMNLLASSLVIALLNTHYVKTMMEILGIFGINLSHEQRHSR